MFALLPKVPKIQRPKGLKIDIVDNIHCRLTSPLQGTPKNIHIHIRLISVKTRVIGLHLLCHSVGLTSFKFSLYRLRKTHALCYSSCTMF